MKFDLNKFKKVSSDGKSTTLQHPSGHKIVIAHSALSPKMRGDLAALPSALDEGGPVVKDMMFPDSEPKPKPEQSGPKMAEGGKYVDPKAAAEIEKGATESGPGLSEMWTNLKRGLGVEPEPTPKAQGGKVKMADGGEADNSDTMAIAAKLAPLFLMADGGKVADKKPLRLAEGTDEPVSQSMQDSPDQIAQDAASQGSKQQAPVVVNVNSGPQPTVPQQVGQAIGRSIAGSPQVQALKYGIQGAKAVGQGLSQGFQGLNSGLSGEPLPQEQDESVAPGGGLTAGPAAPVGPSVPQAPQAQQANADPYGLDAYARTYSAGIAGQQQGLRDEAKAVGAQGDAQAKVLANSAVVKQKILNDAQDEYIDLNNEHNQLMEDYKNQHIDPNHYMDSLGAGGKIATVIGLILGGAGAAASRTEDTAMAYVNSQIARDIDRQKTEMGQKMNLLAANTQQYGNIKDGIAMTTAAQTSMVADQFAEAAAKAQSPIAAARAMQASNKLKADSAAIISQTAMRRGILGGNGLSGGQVDDGTMGQRIQLMRQLDPNQAKDLESRFVPGTGLATVPVPQGVRDNLIGKQQLNDMASNFYAWAKNNSGSVDPKVVNEGKTRAAELQSAYRNAINGGVFKKGEQEFIDNIIDSDPNKFFNSIRVLPKLQEVIRSNAVQLDNVKRSLGLPIKKFHEGKL